MHTTGVRVSISRTITPAKYTALMAYRATDERKTEKIKIGIKTLRGKSERRRESEEKMKQNEFEKEMRTLTGGIELLEKHSLFSRCVLV